MVDTTDIKEVVVTPETPLNPSPKRVEGHEIGETVSADLGSVAGTLHKPPLKIETEDRGQSTAEELVKSAEERPQVFKNVVLDTLKAKGLIQIKDKNALVDRFGNPVIKSNVGETVTIDEIDTELAAAGKVIGSDGHGNAVWLDKVNIIKTEDIASVLDIVKVGDNVAVGNQVSIINYVNRSEYPYAVSAFLIDGENDAIHYVTYLKESGEGWTADSTETIFPTNKGTNLYKHHIVFTTDDELDIISNVPNVTTSYAQIQSLFISMYIARASSANYSSGPVIEMYMNGDDFEIKYYDSDEGVRSISLQAHDIDTDTVTPL